MVVLSIITNVHLLKVVSIGLARTSPHALHLCLEPSKTRNYGTDRLEAVRYVEQRKSFSHPSLQIYAAFLDLSLHILMTTYKTMFIHDRKTCEEQT